MTQKAKANSEQEATRKAAEAAYIQSGTRDLVERYAKNLERRYVPVFVMKHGGIVMFLAETVINEQIRIKFEWSFP